MIENKGISKAVLQELRNFNKTKLKANSKPKNLRSLFSKIREKPILKSCEPVCKRNLRSQIRSFKPQLELNIANSPRNRTELSSKIRSFKREELKEQKKTRNRKELLSVIRGFKKSKLIKRKELMKEIQLFHPCFLTRTFTQNKTNLDREEVLFSIKNGDLNSKLKESSETKNIQLLFQQIRDRKKLRKVKAAKNRRLLLQKIRTQDFELRNMNHLFWEIENFDMDELNHVETKYKNDLTWNRIKLNSMIPIYWYLIDVEKFNIVKTKNFQDLLSNIRGKNYRLKKTENGTANFQNLLASVRRKDYKLRPYQSLLNEVKDFNLESLKKTSDVPKKRPYLKRSEVLYEVKEFELYLLNYVKGGTRCIQSLLSNIRSFDKKKLSHFNTFNFQKLKNEIQNFDKDKQLVKRNELMENIRDFDLDSLKKQRRFPRFDELQRMKLLRSIRRFNPYILKKQIVKIDSYLNRCKFLLELNCGIVRKQRRKLWLLFGRFTHSFSDLKQDIRTFQKSWLYPTSTTNRNEFLQEVRRFKWDYPDLEESTTKNFQNLLSDIRKPRKVNDVFEDLKNFKKENLRKVKTKDVSLLLNDIRNYQHSKLRNFKQLHKSIHNFDPRFLNKVHPRVSSNLLRANMMYGVKNFDIYSLNYSDVKDISSLLQDIRNLK